MVFANKPKKLFRLYFAIVLELSSGSRVLQRNEIKDERDDGNRPCAPYSSTDGKGIDMNEQIKAIGRQAWEIRASKK